MRFISFVLLPIPLVVPFGGLSLYIAALLTRAGLLSECPPLLSGWGRRCDVIIPPGVEFTDACTRGGLPHSLLDHGVAVGT